MKTVEEIAKEKVSWNDVKEKYLKFHRMDKFTENMAIDIDFGYWLANEVINEVLRWRDQKEELPNEIDLEQLSRLLAYSDKYEISIQFWPKQIAVYIAKDGVDLQDYGGDFDFAIGRSIEYLDRMTGNYR